MSLYKDPKDVVVSVEIFRKDKDIVEFMFIADCGKHGTHEIIDGYKLEPKRLLEILQDRNDYTDKELE